MKYADRCTWLCEQSTELCAPDCRPYGATSRMPGRSLHVYGPVKSGECTVVSRRRKGESRHLAGLADVRASLTIVGHEAVTRGHAHGGKRARVDHRIILDDPVPRENE